MQYVFILGRNPKLSTAEIMAVLPKAEIVSQGNSFLIIENKEFDAEELMAQLGGTIKIAQLISGKVEVDLMVKELKKLKKDSKLNFGISFYECPKTKVGMEVKKALKKAGINSRLVVGKDKALSSVIVTKNKVNEFLVLGNNFLAQTLAIQDFEDYGHRDFGRPSRDMKSGSMPPKLAQIMVNLAQIKTNQKIHDPFCGSGTILQEAALLEYENVSGSDISEKAVKDSLENLKWLETESNLRSESIKKKIQDIVVNKIDVRSLSQDLSDIDAIVSEPFLGPPLRGFESEDQIQANLADIEDLYVEAFEQFSKVLNPGGKVVIIFPSFRVGKRIYSLHIFDKIKKLGFTQTSADDLFYSREGQHVFRNVRVFVKS